MNYENNIDLQLEEIIKLKDLEELEHSVDIFSQKMKMRLQEKQDEGYGGWKELTKEQLAPRLLVNAADGAITGNKESLIDVANLAMMIYKSNYNIPNSNWPNTIDAQEWATEFCKRNSASDHGTILGWFANAIMAGYDKGRSEKE